MKVIAGGVRLCKQKSALYGNRKVISIYKQLCQFWQNNSDTKERVKTLKAIYGKFIPVMRSYSGQNVLLPVKGGLLDLVLPGK